MARDIYSPQPKRNDQGDSTKNNRCVCQQQPRLSLHAHLSLFHQKGQRLAHKKQTGRDSNTYGALSSLPLLQLKKLIFLKLESQGQRVNSCNKNENR